MRKKVGVSVDHGEHGAPPRDAGLFEREHVGFSRKLVSLAGVATDAGADHVLPSRFTATMAGNDMVKVQLFEIMANAAVLAGVIIALIDVLPTEFHLLSRKLIIAGHHDDGRDAETVIDRVNHIRSLVFERNLQPGFRIVSVVEAIRIGMHDLSVPQKHEGKRAPHRAQIDRLPEPVQYEHLLVEHGLQDESDSGFDGRKTRDEWPDFNEFLRLRSFKKSFLSPFHARHFRSSMV